MGDHFAVAASELEWVEISPEMTMVLGRGQIARAPAPSSAVALIFEFGGPDALPALRYAPRPETADGAEGATLITLLIGKAAFLRIAGATPPDTALRGYHLPADLRTIALALRDCTMSGEAQTVYRAAKSIELFCETVRLLGEGQLIPLASEGQLSAADTRRVIVARRIIDERWAEKLTLDAIARSCGLNRAKLTRGFRQMFDCTIAEAISEKRLQEARHMLRTTDMPVSSIGYETGYLNNASFTRAFGRRFGAPPSNFRASQMAA